MKTYSIEEKAGIDNILKSCKVCFVGMADKDGYPYVLPMNFGFDGTNIYLHSAQEGRSISILEQNPNVCITFCTSPNLIWQHPKVACSYRMRADSVICEGKVRFVDDYTEKENALDLIMQQYSDKSFDYSKPAVMNVKIWKVKVEIFAAKSFGVRHSNSRLAKKDISS